MLQAAARHRRRRRACSGVLDAIGEQPAGRWLRTLWLQELARREDWAAFRAAWRDSEDTALRCA